MVKQFAGFTPEQLGRIDPSLQGMQSDEQQKIIAANPALAARVGKMSEVAQQRIGMAQGGYAKKGYAAGGIDLGFMAGLAGRMAQNQPNPSISTPKYSTMDMPTDRSKSNGMDPARKVYTDSLTALQNARNAQAANPSDANLVTALQTAEANTNLAQEQLATAEQQFKTTNMPTSAELISGALKDPTSMVTSTDVAATQVNANQLMDESTGQLTGPAPTAGQTTATTAGPVTTPTATAAPQVQTATAQQGVGQALQGQQAAQGQVSQQAQVQAAQGSPQQLSQLGLQAAQGQAATVQGMPSPMQMTAAETISGSGVDQAQVDAAFGTGQVQAASVQGEMANLMNQFQGKQPPAWAAGAMRQATAALASRGLGASSMAGQAIVQAAMESALPIAQMDASNKQQMALFKAEQRANFMNQDFDQKFQAKVRNAARVSEIANINFSAEQQVALENARMAQTVNLANLDSSSAKILSDAAALSQMDMTNLNNRQQAQVQNAQSFLQMDMANLSNEQQTGMFKMQSMVNSILSDTSAENASRQFNASSQMQTDQFFSNLTATVDMYNNEQVNKMNMFNAGEANALEKFNSEMINMRDQFNASNSLIVDQANTNWFKSIATADTAAINEANRLDAAAANGMTNLAFNSFMQEVRDIMSFAWQTENNDADRATQLAIAKISSDDAKAAASANKSAGFWSALGSVAAAVIR